MKWITSCAVVILQLHQHYDGLHTQLRWSRWEMYTEFWWWDLLE